MRDSRFCCQTQTLSKNGIDQSASPPLPEEEVVFVFRAEIQTKITAILSFHH